MMKETSLFIKQGINPMHSFENNTLKDLFLKIKSLSEKSFPHDFEVSGWWQNLQKTTIYNALASRSIEKAIHLAQDPSSGFDHRREPAHLNKHGISVLEIIHERLRLIRDSFPSVDLMALPQESNFSNPNTIVNVDGSAYSNVFLYHLYFYLRIKDCLSNHNSKRPKSSREHSLFLEIGGGYGGLARIFSKSEDTNKYIICDLAESLFFSYLFLSSSLPDKKIVIADTPDCQSKDFDILLVPVQYYSALLNYQYDAVINTGSLQEMPDKTIIFWMNLIKEIVGDGLFYSFNYHLNPNKAHTLGSGKIMNKSCFLIDKDWEIVRYKINPEVLVADAEYLNWLEFCGVLRSGISASSSNKEEEPDKLDLSEFDSSLERLWSLHFNNPRNKKHITMLLKAIDQFKRGHIGKSNISITPRINLPPQCRILNCPMDKAYYPVFGEEVYLKEMLKSAI